MVKTSVLIDTKSVILSGNQYYQCAKYANTNSNPGILLFSIKSNHKEAKKKLQLLNQPLQESVDPQHRTKI